MCRPFPPRIWHPVSAWVFVLHFLLSAKPPPAKDWCAQMIYGSDCQRLLKPIQFQDSGSHFLSFMAHLMNSHYQLTCFIIVKTLIEVVFKKNMWKRKNIKRLHHIFFFLYPRLLCLKFTAPSFSHSATCWPYKLVSSLSFDSLVPAFIWPGGLLVWAFSSPDGQSRGK